MAANATTSEATLRRLLRAKSLRLGSLKLQEAIEAMCGFYADEQAYEVLPDGDGLAAYVEVSNYGRGTRLEVGICRLFRLKPEGEPRYFWPAIRLRLRTCFKWDAEVFSKVLPEGTWCEVCWDRNELPEFKERVAQRAAYRVLSERVASEAAVSLEETQYAQGNLRPAANVRQMWWGVHDVVNTA